jgi:hypothetical protein
MPNVTDLREKSRRSILLGGLASILTGCVESPVIVNAFEALKYSIVGFPDVPIKREAISKIPYASISAKIGIGPRSILILWRRENDDLHWISADRVVVVTRHGRVVKTFGLPENMKNTQELGADPVNRTLHLAKGQPTFNRSVDLDVDNRYSIPIESVFEVVGAREITIAELKIKTILIVERNTARTVNWSFTNYFWVDAFDGFVWKSRQHIARNFDPIEIEVLKPAI